MRRTPRKLRLQSHSAKIAAPAKGTSKRPRAKQGQAVPLESVEFVARPFDPQRDNERISLYHCELLLEQNVLWRSLSGLPSDPSEFRRAMQRRQEGPNWVRQLHTMAGRGDGTVIMLDAPNGEAAGYAFITESVDPLNYERMGVIGELFVEEVWRTRGAGAQILQAAEKWLSERGIRAFQVFVTRTNEGAVDLYKQGGYSTFDYRMVKRL